MFDAKITFELIKKALLEPQPTWQEYLDSDKDWQQTAIQLSGPLVIGCLTIGYILSLILSSGFSYSFWFFIQSLIMACAGLFLWALIINFFAGQFKGTANYDRAFAAVSLAAVPAYIGYILNSLPWLGWILSLGLSIYSLVLLYQIIPLSLSVPDDSRTAHFVVSLISMLVLGVLLGSLVGVGVFTSSPGNYNMGTTSDNASPGTGLFGGFEQTAKYMEEAETDRYETPEDGKLTREQVTTFINVMDKTAALQNEYSDKLKRISEEESEEPNITDVFSAISGAANVGTAEMKVVKTANLNWAEHQWVRQQLDIARIQKDISDAVRHNYALYMDFEDQLRKHF